MLDKFPGFLGYGGIIAIHADWPIYPRGIGWEFALASLGNFTKNTNFYQIDDIDCCKLFISENPNGFKDPFNYKYYHIAIWDEDLITLKQKGYITGVLELSDFEYDMKKFEEVKSLLRGGYVEDADGNIDIPLLNDKGEVHISKYYKPLSVEDEEDVYCNRVNIPEFVKLTDVGFEKMKELAAIVEISPKLSELTEPFVNISRYDTAIREASLFIETEIKNYHNKSNLYGQKLVNYHIDEVVRCNDNFFSSAIKSYRGELRTIFKFVRNDFAHNFKTITQEQFKFLLNRIDSVYREYCEVINVYFDEI